MPQGDSAIRSWFEKTFTGPTPAQSAAWPVIESGAHTLVISPTGTGKTLAAFLSILHQLDIDHRRNRLQPGIQALYISPLRALAYDLGKNLQRRSTRRTPANHPSASPSARATPPPPNANASSISHPISS